MPDIFLGVGNTSVSKNRQGSYSFSRRKASNGQVIKQTTRKFQMVKTTISFPWLTP